MQIRSNVIGLVLALSLTGCDLLAKENPGCPDKGRLSLVPFAPQNVADHLIKVEDCLVEFIGRIAKGSSSDADVASAAENYCGSYAWYPGIEGESDLVKRERGDALRIVVTDRALQCAVPAQRGTDGKIA